MVVVVSCAVLKFVVLWKGGWYIYWRRVVYKATAQPTRTLQSTGFADVRAAVSCSELALIAYCCGLPPWHRRSNYAWSRGKLYMNSMLPSSSLMSHSVGAYGSKWQSVLVSIGFGQELSSMRIAVGALGEQATSTWTPRYSENRVQGLRTWPLT